MASGRVNSRSFCAFIQASILAHWSGSTRRCTDSAPVGGRPRPRFFLVRDIASLIIFMYQEIELKRSVNFLRLTNDLPRSPPGSGSMQD
jgi:hypothetical protein